MSTTQPSPPPPSVPVRVLERAIEDNVARLRECQQVLSATTPAQYRETVPGAPANSLGRQLRHCLDHYASLFRGLESCRVSYDVRDRDERLEQDPAAARDALDQLVQRLRSLNTFAAEHRLEVFIAAGGVGPSSLLRELDFLLSHTTHHLALMVQLCRAMGVAVDPMVGVAQSTRQVWSMSSPPIV